MVVLQCDNWGPWWTSRASQPLWEQDGLSPLDMVLPPFLVLFGNIPLEV